MLSTGFLHCERIFWEEDKWVFNMIACPIFVTENSEQQSYLTWIEGLKRKLLDRKIKSCQVTQANTHPAQWCNTDLLPYLSSLFRCGMKCTEWINPSYTISDSFHGLPPSSSLSVFLGHTAAFLTASDSFWQLPPPPFPVTGMWVW